MGNAKFCLHFGVGKLKVKKFKAVFRLNSPYAFQKHCQINRREKRKVYIYIKVKQSRYRPGVAQRVPGI